MGTKMNMKKLNNICDDDIWCYLEGVGEQLNKLELRVAKLEMNKFIERAGDKDGKNI